MGTEKINRLKIVLVEQVGKERSDRFALVFQYKSTLFGDADEDSLHIECRCEKID